MAFPQKIIIVALNTSAGPKGTAVAINSSSVLFFISSHITFVNQKTPENKNNKNKTLAMGLE